MKLSSKRDCKQWLLSNNEFRCGCGSNEFSHIRDYKRRCQSCKLWRSVTYGTIFHGVRFGLLTAFRMLVDYVESGKNLPGAVAAEHKINRKSARKFLNKLSDNRSEVMTLYDKLSTNNRLINKTKLDKLVEVSKEYVLNGSKE